MLFLKIIYCKDEYFKKNRFDDFVGVFQENKNETSTWFDPVRANAPTQQSQNSVVRKATQVYVIIKEKCKLK